MRNSRSNSAQSVTRDAVSQALERDALAGRASSALYTLPMPPRASRVSICVAARDLRRRAAHGRLCSFAQAPPRSLKDTWLSSRSRIDVRVVRRLWARAQLRRACYTPRMFQPIMRRRRVYGPPVCRKSRSRVRARTGRGRALDARGRRRDEPVRDGVPASRTRRFPLALAHARGRGRAVRPRHAGERARALGERPARARSARALPHAERRARSRARRRAHRARLSAAARRALRAALPGLGAALGTQLQLVARRQSTYLVLLESAGRRARARARSVARCARCRARVDCDRGLRTTRASTSCRATSRRRRASTKTR